MSYAIIRNEKISPKKLSVTFRHNYRRNQNYSNTCINTFNSYKNIILKNPTASFMPAFQKIFKQRNYKGQIKETSKIICEYVVTSDKEFFNSLSYEETLNFFQSSYNFIKSYKDLGDENILGAVIHFDETTPHMHVNYIPVVHTKDKQGNPINKVCCSDFWKGKQSYEKLQDSYYNFIKTQGFDLERGEKHSQRKHYSVQEYKNLTDYEIQKYEKTSNTVTQLPDNYDVLPPNEKKRIIKRIIYERDILVKRYTKIKNITETQAIKNIELEQENDELINDYNTLYDENESNKNKLEIIYEAISEFFHSPISLIKNIVENYIK